MQKISIKNFKAYQEAIDIPFTENKKNLLVYGENGSGKSSLYEAIKVIFFKDKLEELIPDASTPEEEMYNKEAFWRQYNNQQSSENFEITINDTSYKSFDLSNYQVFMIAMDRFCIKDRINLIDLLKQFDLQISNIDSLCQTKYEQIQNNINQKLKDFQEENIEITIDNEDDFSIQIKDNIRGLEYKNNLGKYFNEAKLNLIVLLLIFEAILISKDTDKTKILVLDDFITSLDMANRTFLVKYIFDNFEDTQKVILTHNVYFYNLIMYIANDIYQQRNNWIFANLYEINNKHKLYAKGELTVRNILSRYNKPNLSDGELESIGNDIRKRFEQLLHELSKLLMIGAVEESNKIIENIEKGQVTYWKKKDSNNDKNKTATDLLIEIENILNSGDSNSDIMAIIEDFKIEELSNLQKIISELKLYRKVTMHPMSHASNGEQTPFTQKEIEKSLILLEKLEQNIKDLSGSDVDGA
jgi:energy-coupling factor transporter ATP-binding protein EcfA2